MVIRWQSKWQLEKWVEMTTEKWGVIVPISEHMKRLFSAEELTTFAKVLAIYTIPEGIPQDVPKVDRSRHMMEETEFLRAYVRVEGVFNPESTFETAKLYEGSIMEPEGPGIRSFSFTTDLPGRWTWDPATGVATHESGHQVRADPEVIPGTSSGQTG